MVKQVDRDPNHLIIRFPDNFHNHFRDDFRLYELLIFTLQQFGRAIAMPNLPEIVATGRAALRYRDQIMSHATRLGYPDFEPLMTIYITHETTPADIFEAKRLGVVAGKIYPKNMTTGSSKGIADFNDPNFHAVLDAMAACRMLCLIHPEVADPKVGAQFREQAFRPTLRMIIDRHPNLKVVVEHISSAAMVETVLDLPMTVAATVTPQHLLESNRALWNPHFKCMPELKTPDDRGAIQEQVLAGNPKFFFGDDGAPHHRCTKENLPDEKVARGMWYGPATLVAVIELFDRHRVLDKFEAFVSEYGARFYGLPLNRDKLVLRRRRWKVPSEVAGVVPATAGRYHAWEPAAIIRAAD